ncbi:MAG: hypothetical protein ACW99J_08905 [Candidatus Thorarchaeota archaeon]|jgi:hypothetical protein
MIKGPCRGESCDFWARVKIRKASVSEMGEEIRNVMFSDTDECRLTLDEAIQRYWLSVGIQSMNRLCREEPELCEKIKRVEEHVLGKDVSSDTLD